MIKEYEERMKKRKKKKGGDEKEKEKKEEESEEKEKDDKVGSSFLDFVCFHLKEYLVWLAVATFALTLRGEEWKIICSDVNSCHQLSCTCHVPLLLFLRDDLLTLGY